MLIRFGNTVSSRQTTEIIPTLVYVTSPSQILSRQCWYSFTAD